MRKKDETKINNDNIESIRKEAETGNLSAISALINALKEREMGGESEPSAKSEDNSNGNLQNVKITKQLKNGKIAEKDSDEKKEQEKSYMKLKKQAEDGDPEAMYKIGEAFLHGKGVKKDKQLGMKWIDEAAEKGNADALFYKAEYMFVNRKKTESIQLYNAAAYAGSLDAMYKLGLLYKIGMILKPDIEKAIMWFEKAFQKGFVRAGIALGDCYLDCGKFKEALSYYCSNMIKNNTEALAKAGSLMIAHGDPKEGVEFLNRAASDLNNPYGVSAALALGNHYYSGTILKRDKLKAYEYYLMAAGKGDCQARLKVGNMYYNGDGIEQDKVKAFEYLKDVSKNLRTDYNLEAICNLGQLYYDGIVVGQNKKIAMKLFRMAVQLGSKKAEELIKNLDFD